MLPAPAAALSGGGPSMHGHRAFPGMLPAGEKESRAWTIREGMTAPQVRLRCALAS